MRLENVIFDARDPAALARFWAEALGWRTVVFDDGEIDLEPPTEDPDDPVARFPALVFGPGEGGGGTGEGRERIHLDLATGSVEDQAAWVERLLALGATRADVGQAADVPWVVLADPEGNAFCVLDPRPEYPQHGDIGAIVLAAHDAQALRDVWAAATGWTLVRDDADCVAFQRPDGAGPLLEIITRPTMPPDDPTEAGPNAKNRIHLDVAPGAAEDQAEMVAKVIAAGARHVDIGQTGDEPWVVLADQEGNELCILTPRD